MANDIDAVLDINAVRDIDPQSSILFLGSGFSVGARNIGNKTPPNGRALRRHFIEVLGLRTDTEYDLQVLTEEFAEEDSKKLRDELYRMFRISEVTPDQKSILRPPWRRIYTTNYDDCVELFRHNENIAQNSFDISENVPNRIPNGAVVHLHGSIRLVTQDNVKESIVLGESSYVNQYVVRSPWYNQFQRDIAFASNLYILGYSLSDYHIAGLLLANQQIAKRTIFIQGPTLDRTFVRRTSQYGRSLFIGTDGFAKILSRTSSSETPSLEKLKAFRSLAPTRDSKTSARPTASEVYDLLVYGAFDAQRLSRSQPKEDYAIARAKLVQTAADAVESKAALAVDGRLGNGKSIFLHLLAFELSARGWKCFMLRPDHPDLQKEISALANVEKVILFIEHYAKAQDILRSLHNALPNAKLVVEVRTGTFEVRFHEVVELLPKPFDRVSLNALSRDEIQAFRRLCKVAGLPLPSGDRTGDLRDMLLALFENRAVKERVREALTPLFERRASKRILAMIMLVASSQSSVGAAFVRSVIGEDPFLALKPLADLSHEIIETTGDTFKARSAVFSSFVINSFIESDEIADAVVEITLAAAKRREERPYRILMANMMAYSSLRRTLLGKSDREVIIVNIYERLRYDERVNDEPLFWLQYAIAMAETPRLDTADEYIATARRKAEALPGFRTYQIDTQAFRIALLIAARDDSGNRVTNIGSILEGLEQIDTMIDDSSQRSYAVQVLDGVAPFVARRGADLEAGERTALQFWLLKVSRSLSLLPDDFKTTTGSDLTRVRIEAAAATFLRKDRV